MPKLALIGATVIGAVVLSASPISVSWTDSNLTVSEDRAVAEIGRPATPGSVAGVRGEPTDERCGAARQVLPATTSARCTDLNAA